MKSPINKKKISPRVVVYDPTNYSPVRARRTNVNEYKNEFLATKRYFQRIFDATHNKTYFYCEETSESFWVDPSEDYYTAKKYQKYHQHNDFVSNFTIHHCEEYEKDFYNYEGEGGNEISVWDVDEVDVVHYVMVKDYTAKVMKKEARLFEELDKWLRIFDAEYQICYYVNRGGVSLWVRPEGECWISAFIVTHDEGEERDFYWFDELGESSWEIGEDMYENKVNWVHCM